MAKEGHGPRRPQQKGAGRAKPQPWGAVACTREGVFVWKGQPVRRAVWEFDAEREPSLFLFSHVKIMVDFPRRTLQQVEV